MHRAVRDRRGALHLAMAATIFAATTSHSASSNVVSRQFSLMALTATADGPTRHDIAEHILNPSAARLFAAGYDFVRTCIASG